jgi:hypothetical protein
MPSGWAAVPLALVCAAGIALSLVACELAFPTTGLESAGDQDGALDGGVMDQSVLDVPSGDGATSSESSGGIDSGRPDGDARADAADGVSSVITVVQTQSNASDGGTALSVTVSPIQAADFVAVLVTYSFGDAISENVVGVSDDGPAGSNKYVSANLQSVVAPCQASEIWYARNTTPGATTVNVTVSAYSAIQLWVIEASGLRATGGVDQGTTGSGGATTSIQTPAVAPTGYPALIVSAAGSCGAISGVDNTSPFTGLPAQDGNDAAYYVATTAGSYGPIYGSTNDSWNASVAAFR